MKNIKTVLIVDDDPESSFILEHKIKKINKDYKVISLENPKEAISEIQNGLKYDILLVDRRLGNCIKPKEIKEISEIYNPEAKTILISADLNEKIAKKEGFTEYAQKYNLITNMNDFLKKYF